MLDVLDQACILIVEDDDAFRGRLAKAFHKRGFNTLQASGVNDALDAIDEANPQHAVIDLSLKDGTGLQIVDVLKNKRPESRALILTAYGDIPTAVAAVQLGAVDYMCKSAGADEILDALMSPEGERPPPPTHPITPDAARQGHIEHVFHETRGNVSETARLLNMHRRTLQRILKRHVERDHETL